MNLSTILTIIFILAIFKLLRDSLFYVWLWQVKEYRIDRMISHLKENVFRLSNNSKNPNIYHPHIGGNPLNKPSILLTGFPIRVGNDIFGQSGWGILIAIIVFISYFIFLKNYPFVFQYLVLVFFAFVVLEIIKEIKNRNLKRPKPTLKIMLIFFLLTIVYLLIAFCWASSLAIKEAKLPIGSLASGAGLMLFIYIVNPLIISSIILAIEPIFYFQKKRIIKRAAEKMKSLKKVKVIGITGSYGKTSTKEFLYAILSQKYKVVKTEGNNNTNIGVAYTVLNKVSDEYDYFICEMGAYKRDEIKEMCDIVKPSIGILTGINNQHIDLFGSQENIVKAKFELVEALPEEGLAVINEKLKAKNEKRKFKVKNVKYFSLDSIENIKVFQDYAEFDFQTTSSPSLLKDENDSGKNNYLLKFKLNLLGRHYIENILSCIIVAEHLGMSLEEIKNSVEKIKPVKYMMRKTNGLNNSIFIDDSYSANTDGVLAALDYLDEAYSDYKKIIVFPGIIELGKEREEAHRKLFKRIGEVCDAAYILGIMNYELRIMNKECNFVFEKDFCKVTNMLKNNLDKNTVVLFESRGAGAVMGKLKMESEKLKMKGEE